MPDKTVYCRREFLNDPEVDTDPSFVQVEVKYWEYEGPKAKIFREYDSVLTIFDGQDAVVLQFPVDTAEQATNSMDALASIIAALEEFCIQVGRVRVGEIMLEKERKAIETVEKAVEEIKSIEHDES